MFDWQVLATVAAPIIALFVGIWVSRRFESRPIVLSHWGHVSSFNHESIDGTVTTINTHSVVLRNVGRRAATNVRMSHFRLPSFNIWPPVQYTVEQVPNAGEEIVIPIMVPDQHLTVSYLYFPPITYAEVNNGVKFDEGFATPIPVLLQRQYPSWFTKVVGALLVLGIATLLYGVFEIGTFVAELIYS